MASQKPTSKPSSSSSTSANTNHDRTRSVILQPKSNPIMSFAYGAPSIPGVNDAHTSPRRSRGRAGSATSTNNPNYEGAGDGHSEASTSRRTASNYPGAWNGDTSSPKNNRSNRLEGNDENDDAGSIIRQEPAAVRYARLKQRLKDTGSSRPPAANNEEDEEDSGTEAGNQAHGSTTAQQQRGTGTGVIQHNEPPKEAGYKDTSVNIATAFWQAAGGPARSAMPGPRPASLAQAATANDANHQDIGDDDTSRLNDDVSVTQSPEQSTTASARKEYPNPISSGKKRKKPTGGYKGTVSEKDRPFKISKKDLNKESSDDSDEYEEEGVIDLEELKFEMGYGPARKSGVSTTSAAQGVKKPKAKQAVKKTTAEGDASAPKARRKSSGQNKDGAYKPGQDDDDDEEDEDDFDESTSTRRKQAKGKGKARGTSVAASEQSRGVSEAPSTTAQSMTSYYLQEPEPAPITSGQTTQQAARLTQIHPKTNTYQPYFAFSTSTTSLSKASTQNRPRAPSSSTNQSSIPDSTRGVGNASRAGITSSNASFNERGSEYDYAEEERMLATLQAAKERAETGRLLPEGRPFSSLVGRDRSMNHNREVSLDTSEDSRDNIGPAQSQQQQQKQAAGARKLGPRRGPPPPDRESSILSESASSALNGYTTPAPDDPHSSPDSGNPRSIGRKLGQLVRKLFVILYWITVGPYKFLKGKDLNTLLKWAAAVGFTALVLAAMQEQRASYSTPPITTRRWHIPFVSSQPSSSSDFSAPNGLPNNLDELVARLTNLEASFSSLSSKQSSDHLHMFENTRSTSETVKRLTMLEADFEAERRKMTKANEGNRKDILRTDEKVEANLKGVKTQLDYLAEKVKTLSSDRKQDALDTAKLKDGVSTINKDISNLSRRLADLQKEVETGHDSENVAKLVSKAIEDILPSRMAVSVDQKTGQVQVDPKFWQHLRSAFSSSVGAGEGGKAVASWDDFLVANQQSLQRFISEDVNSRFSKGAILSKKAFSDILSREIEELRVELSHSSQESLSKLSSDFTARLAKATSSPTPSGKAAPTIKLSSGEDLQSIVMQLIDSALEKYSKDVLAKPDFALYSAGGRVIPSLTSPTYEIRPNTFTGSLLSKVTGRGVIRGKAPVTALHPDISVGQCWPFTGQSGQLGILLSRRIVPEDITIEHASKDVALNVSSAPKTFEVWGLIEDQESLEKLASLPSVNTSEDEAQERLIGNKVLLVSGEYDINASSHIQTFPVEQAVRDLNIPINVVIVRVLENHGNEALSCLYRVRVGGTVVEGDG